MKLTITDVAKAANVSKSTVSKVINNHPSIPYETKQRIQKIMDDLNYIPNSMAQSLAQNSSYNISIIIDVSKRTYFLNQFFYNILGGAESISSSRNYEVTICNVNSMDSNEDFLNRFVYNRKSAGIIIPSSVANKNILQKLNDCNFPYVVIGQPTKSSQISNLSWVDINNTVAGELATEHLIEQGCKRIAFIGGKKDEPIAFSRLTGYKNVLLNLKIAENKQYIKEGNSDENSGYNLMEELFVLPEQPEAIICVNNFVAYGALKSIKQHGLRIPEDISIVTFDNYPLAPYTTPTLTCLDIDTFELGVIATTMLINKIEDPDSSNTINLISPKLLVRESTKKSEK